MSSFLGRVWSSTSARHLISAEKALLDRVKGPGKVVPRSVRINNDLQIHTIIVGDSAKPPLVLLHGYGGGIGLWYKNLAGLSENHRVYAIDLLGFGQSSRPTPSFSHNNIPAAESFFVDSFEQWRTNVGLDRFHLLGHSFGGYISTVYADLHPELFTNNHLILASPFGVPELPEFLKDEKDPKAIEYREKRGLISRLLDMNVTPASIIRMAGPVGFYLARKFVELRFVHSLPQDEIKLLVEYLYHNWAASGSGEFALSALFDSHAFARTPLIHRLKRLKAPTSFIYGERDWMNWSAAAQLVQSGQNPNLLSLSFIPKVGHQLFLDDPISFNERVNAILSQPAKSITTV